MATSCLVTLSKSLSHSVVGMWADNTGWLLAGGAHGAMVRLLEVASVKGFGLLV